MSRTPAVCASGPEEFSSNEERRASVRYRTPPLKVACQKLDDPAGLDSEALVHDISRYGIGLLFRREVPLGILLEVDLRRPNGIPVRTLVARVVHGSEESPGRWLAGCAFVHELLQNELELFQAQAVRPTTPDCRRWVRFPCNVETVCYTCETTPGERRRARVLNISPGGLGLLLHCQFAQGTLLQFDLPNGQDQPARGMLIRVVRVLEHGEGNWFLGCEFAGELAEDDLRALLR